jgi:hypothetical protein
MPARFRKEKSTEAEDFINKNNLVREEMPTMIAVRSTTRPVLREVTFEK